MKKPSLKDIAKKTGVSASTVSRVLNGKAESFRISPSTSELVLKIATEIGYIPNQIARGLRTRKSHPIGLIIPNISNPYFSRICRTIEIAANPDTKKPTIVRNPIRLINLPKKKANVTSVIIMN